MRPVRLAAILLAVSLPGGPAGADTCFIADIATFLERCPASDPAYVAIRADFKIRRDGVLIQDVHCSEPVSQMDAAVVTRELVFLQGLRTLYYLDRGRVGHLPWTAGTLYEWLGSQIAGIHIRSDAPGARCCDDLPDGKYIVFPPLSQPGRELGREWRGVAVGISGMLHEARHADGLHRHVTCCPAQRPGDAPACDQTYDESDLGAYGVQYWLLRSLLSGHLHTGYGCLPADQIRDCAPSWRPTSTRTCATTSAR